MPGPIPISAAVSGASMTIEFNVQLDPSGPTTGDFEVRVNGDVVGIQSVSTGPFEVFVTLVEPVPAGAAVGVSYSDPTAGDDFEAIQDIFVGDDAGSFLDLPVNNLTPAPTLSISVDDDTLGAEATAAVTFTFSEAPTGFDVADVIATGGAISNFAVTVDPKVYIATFTPTVEGMGTVEVANGAWTGAGEASGGGDSVDITSDLTAPGLTITADDTTPGAGETATLTFTFTEEPANFSVSDVQATNGSISGFTVTADPMVYTAIFTPAADGPASVNVIDGDYEDAAGNPGTGDNLSLTNDFVGPTVTTTVDDTQLASGETATVTFSFSDAPVGFDISDVAVVNGMASDLAVTADPKVYTATFTPTAEGPVLVGVNNGSYADANGNEGAPGGSDPFNADFTAPTLTVTADDTTLSSGQAATITFTFSEVPSGFVAADVSTANGAISNFSVTGDAAVYTATFTPTGSGAAAVGVTNGQYADAAGNLGGANGVALTVAAPPVPPAPPSPTPTLTEQADVVTLTSNAGPVSAGGGADQVTGSASGDFVNGNAGQDSISAGGGQDSVMGGRDNDLVQGNAGEDVMFGDLGDDIVHGGRDNDFAQGNVGDDAVFGDLGDDIVRGGKGDDSVSGGDGADRLFGDVGSDVFIGGSGADVFHIADGGEGRDVVADFVRAEGDVIAVGQDFAVDFDALMANVSAAENGDAVIALGAQTIVLAGVSVTSLTASDFLFV